jgi:hypothetical protein
MKVYDKNNRELKIGDTVHYKRAETTREVDMGNGRTKTMTRPAKDVIFTIDTFLDSPFVKHGGYDPRMNENRIWISGPELDITRGGSRNSVSPLAVVKIDTMVKKKVSPLNFTKVGDWSPKKKLDVRDAFTSDKPLSYVWSPTDSLSSHPSLV